MDLQQPDQPHGYGQYESTVLLDGLGRTKQTPLNSDPEGADYSVVTYDALGRVTQGTLQDGSVANRRYYAVAASGCLGPSWNYDSWGSRTRSEHHQRQLLPIRQFHAPVNSQNRLSGSPYQ